MRHQKPLIALLKGLVDLLADEAERNPAFGERLEAVLAALPAPAAKPARAPRKSAAAAKPEAPLPDIHAECRSRGEPDFRLWLREQPVPTLKAIIKAQGFDATGKCARWRDAEKLANLIADGLAIRLQTGSHFLGSAG